MFRTSPNAFCDRDRHRGGCTWTRRQDEGSFAVITCIHAHLPLHDPDTFHLSIIHFLYSTLAPHLFCCAPPGPLLVPSVLKRSRPGSETWSWGSETPSKVVTTGMVTVAASSRRFEGPYFTLRLDLTAARRLPGGDGCNRCTSPPQPLSYVLTSEPLLYTRSSRYIWTWVMCGRGSIH